MQRLALLVSFGLAIGLPIAGQPAFAAERVVLKYQIFRESVSVEDLTNLAESGEISRGLRAQLRLAGQRPTDLRQTLTDEVSINPLLLDRVLNSPVGDVVLDQVGSAIHTPSEQANREAMRAALVNSATDDGTLSLLEVIQNYPTEEVHVNGDRLADAYNELQSVQQQIENIFSGWNIF